MFRTDGDGEFGWILRILLPIALCISFAFMIWNRPAAPPLKNSLVFGCYTTKDAPAIRLDSAGMHIIQPNFPVIPFHIERHKDGIVISADRPIQAKKKGEQYIYSFYDPGIGWYLSFYHVINGQRYGVTDEADLSSFTMLTRDDGAYLSYMIGATSACGERPTSHRVRNGRY